MAALLNEANAVAMVEAATGARDEDVPFQQVAHLAGLAERVLIGEASPDERARAVEALHPATRDAFGLRGPPPT